METANSWVVERCTCGDTYGGDSRVFFDSREELAEYVAWNESEGDATIRSITSPSGVVWRKGPLLDDPEIPVD